MSIQSSISKRRYGNVPLQADPPTEDKKVGTDSLSVPSYGRTAQPCQSRGRQAVYHAWSVVAPYHAKLTIAKVMTICIILSACAAFAADTMKTGSSMKSEIDIAKAVIVVGKDAEAPEVFAAEELAKYIEKMSGIKLPIAKDNEAVTNENLIFIGTLKSNDKIQEIVKKGEIKTDKLDKEKDSFIIKSVDNKLVLLGGNPRSALYSVYAFLERFGCLWPAPGADFVPAVKDISIQSLDIAEKADLDYRVCFGGGIESVDWVDWLAKNRVNWIMYSFSVASSFCGNPSWDAWKKNNIAAELAKRGIKIDFGVDYAVTYFLPPSKYYKEHPEYYALMDGKRIKDQVCVSNPDVIRLEAENIIEFLKNNPEVGMIDLCPGDGYDWCDCEQCVKLDLPIIKSRAKQRVTSNSYMHFINGVSRRVNDVLPDIKFGSEAYAMYAEAPRMTLKDRNPNLMSMFCFYTRCPSHAICDQDCAQNRFFHSEIEKWAQWYGDKKRVIPLDLDCGLNGSRQMPLPLLKTMAKDFPYYHAFGGTVIWYGGQGWGKIYTLNAYVAMRLAWSVNANLDQILADYFNKYYGKAGGILHDYFMEWENIAHKPGRHYTYCWRYIHHNVDEEEMKRLEGIINKAGQIQESAEIAKRIKAVENNFNYTKSFRMAVIKLDSLQRSAKEGKIDQARKEKEELFGMCAKLSEYEPEPGERVVADILAEITALSVNETNANFVFNGGFEYGRMGWFAEDCRKRGSMDTNEFHGGGQCVRFDNSSPDETCRISQNVALNHPLPDGSYFPKMPKPIKISGWSKARDVNGKGRYCIYVNFNYEDGTSSDAHQVVFEPGTHDWQYGEKIFTPEKSVKGARVFVWFDLAGTAWLDDICLAEVNPVK